MPQLLARFWQEYPEVVMDLRIGDSEEIVDQVRDNQLMLGVVGARFDIQDLHFEPVVSDSLVLVMTPGLHERYAHLPTEELLRKLPWVMREEGSGTRVAMAASLARFGIDIHSLKTVIMVRNAGAMARCLSAGMGAAITSAITVGPEIESGVLMNVELPGLEMNRDFHVVFNKRRSLFPAALRLIDFLKTNAQTIQEG